jgi:hypothetical protein
MDTLELVSEEQVLKAVKEKGPVIPMEVRHEIKAGDSIIIGATLSTLVARGLVFITQIKRGGSPFYYVKGQEEKLADLSKFLNEKDGKTFELLKEKQVIRDKVEDPLTRVSLRNIPDFAKRMDVELNGEKETFWKWYLLSSDDALKLISKKSELKEIKKEKEAEVTAESREKSEIAGEKISESKGKTAPVIAEEQNKKEDSSLKKKKETKPEEEKEEKEGFIEVQQQLNNAGQPRLVAQFNDSFINKVSSFLSDGKIIINEIKQIKKGAEYDLSVEVPTPIGNVDYFCKAKSKKRCNEGDLSSAYLQGRNLRLPILFITTGEVVKKAKEKIKTDFKGIAIKEI